MKYVRQKLIYTIYPYLCGPSLESIHEHARYGIAMSFACHTRSSVACKRHSNPKKDAKDIAIPRRACGWMLNGFMSVDTTLGAGRVFLRRLYEQYATWVSILALSQHLSCH